MLDISTIVRKYGFNESEIKVYLTLINHEQMTGYEVSKLSGVARSKVYNVLENLIQKNMVLVNQTENKMYRCNLDRKYSYDKFSFRICKT